MGPFNPTSTARRSPDAFACTATRNAAPTGEAVTPVQNPFVVNGPSVRRTDWPIRPADRGPLLSVLRHIEILLRTGDQRRCHFVRHAGFQRAKECGLPRRVGGAV